jgi:ribonuclease VapC
VAEVQGKLVARGLSTDDAGEATLSPIREAVSFTPEHARLAGDLVRQTRPYGLSLEDRACLALGIALKAPVYTADRSWKNLKIGTRIHVIR